MRCRLFFIGMLLIATAGISASADQSADPLTSTIDFDTQIMPLLTRHGCNAGSCHGAAIGRGGFKLSLLGGDAVADHDAITHALEGRRVNRFDSDRSLLLLKPSEQVGHEGGLVLAEESKAFELLRQWIDEGASRRDGLSLTSLAISPRDVLLSQTEDAIDFSVSATFSDGTTRDVTDWAVLTPSDEEAVTIDSANRRIVAHRRGVHVVTARFINRIVPIRLTVPMNDAPMNNVPTNDTEVSADSPLQRPADNAIDRFVDAQLERLRLPSSPLTSDHAFLRRVMLDLCGRLPTRSEIEQFIKDESTEKRTKLIEELLTTRDFADYWALKWANILTIDSKQLQAKGADAYHRWLAEQFDRDVPLDQTVTQLVTAVGDSFENGAANFSRFGRSPGDLAEQASRVFMGVRLRCANCHNHPLDHWTQDDYHGLAAIFAKVKRGRVVSVSDRGEVTHPVTRQPAVPRIPATRFLDDGEDGRRVFADWLTGTDNPYLARVVVNRLWRELMGRGLVEPVDDLRATNPATHPELLDWLADDLATNGFHIKSTIAKICMSAAYQRSSLSVPENESDAQFYSHRNPRPLEAEVIADAIGQVTGIPLVLDNVDASSRFVELTDNRADSRVLDLLGRCDRSIGCTTSGEPTQSLTRALHLINGPLLQARLGNSKGTLANLLDSSDDNAWILDQLFLMAMVQPDVSATKYWSGELRTAELSDQVKRRSFFEDVFWGILASNSFATNH